LYGKRAQFVGAILTFFLYVFLFKRGDILKYTVIGLLSLMALLFVFERYSDNLAIRRITSSIEVLTEESAGNTSINKVSAGRGDEIDALTAIMEPLDYIFGKGMGLSIDLDTRDGIKTVGNIHFSPLSFIAKYGMLFTLYLYGYLLFYLLRGFKL